MTSIPPTQDPLPSASFHSRPAQLNKPGARKRAAGPYVRQEQQQAATDEAADKPRSRAGGKQKEAASWPEATDLALQGKRRGFTEKVREETAKRFRSNSYGLPASSLLLLAWRLKKKALRCSKGASIAQVRQNHVFARKWKTTAGARKSTPGSPKPQRGHAKQGARQGGTEPGTTRFRDGRATTRPPAPRRGPAAPAVHARARGPDLESAQV